MGKLKQHHIGIAILIVIHLVGLTGTLFYSEEVMKLTPINLLVSLGIVLWFHQPVNKPFVVYLLIVYLCGFTLEYAGISTGKIFGSYFYGEALGIKVLDTPLIIGINWVMLSYCSVNLASLPLAKLNQATKQWMLPLLSAAFMVCMDVLIEQVCQRFDFWYWKNNTIPLQNYTAWFFFSFAFNFLMVRLGVNHQNKVAVALFILQFLFFLGLNLLLE